MAEHEFFLHLKKDHEEQKKLGGKLIKATDPKERDRLRKELYQSLYPHMIGEEMSIYELLKNSDDEKTRDDAFEGLQEHHVSKLVIKELMELSLESKIFKAKATVLDELNRHHIAEEETDIFNHIKNLCKTQEIKNLFKKYEEAEKKAKI